MASHCGFPFLWYSGNITTINSVICRLLPTTHLRIKEGFRKLSNRQIRTGICKLTQKHGRFVDSHILPKALTRADGTAPGLVQYGRGRKERRWSSWYDTNLVTKEGEDILSAYDNHAITILRKYKMIWSGWGPMQTLTDVHSLPGTPWGVRAIEFEDEKEPKQLRLFLLSILWRAAATERPEFVEIELPPDHMESLRAMVLRGEPEPLNFYSATLTQLSTLGHRHNLTPIAMTKKIPALGGYAERDEPTFRFYIDGLIIHFSRLSVEENDAHDLGPLRVGENNLTMSTVRYEDSAEAENMAIVMMESELGRPLFEMPHGPFSPQRKLFE